MVIAPLTPKGLPDRIKAGDREYNTIPMKEHHAKRLKMLDDLDNWQRHTLLIYVNMPTSVLETIRKHGMEKDFEWLDRLDDHICNALPEQYCRDCLSEHISERRCANSEDDGCYCDDCGSGNVEA